MVARFESERQALALMDHPNIAKATDQRLTDKTFFTEFHAFIGTPAYISPEQAEMSGLDIDTRTDIYSLGVSHDGKWVALGEYGDRGISIWDLRDVPGSGIKRQSPETSAWRPRQSGAEESAS